MTFHASDSWWWQYAFILIGGWLATDMWRFLGAYFGSRISEDSDAIVFVRCLATALGAAVIGNLVVFPSGVLAAVPLWLRVGAAVTGFLAYLLAGRSVLVAILAAEAVLLTAIYSLGLL